jgi:hypothetical protein
MKLKNQIGFRGFKRASSIIFIWKIENLRYIFLNISCYYNFSPHFWHISLSSAQLEQNKSSQ